MDTGRGIGRMIKGEAEGKKEGGGEDN